MLNLISRFVRNDSGAAGVEYGILVAFIAAGIIVAVAGIGGYIADAFTTVCTTLAGAITTSTHTCTAAAAP